MIDGWNGSIFLVFGENIVSNGCKRDNRERI